MEQFQGPGACLVVERIIQVGTGDASQEKGQSCLFVLERYREGSILDPSTCAPQSFGAMQPVPRGVLET